MTEQQIQDEILRYIKDMSYNYAVLIDGEWGSGKTYFVKNTLINIIKKQEELSETPRKIKYISLYGCKSVKEIQENIAWSFAEEAYEKVKNKTNLSETAEKVSSNIFLTSRKIGNLILKKFLPEDDAYEVALDWLNLESGIFIFDDLERCDCPINEVFGILNGLVEHENTKVVIVANEKEVSNIINTQCLEWQYYITLDDRVDWPKSEDNDSKIYGNKNSNSISLNEMERRRRLLFPVKENDNNYKKIREKLIGVTLKYEPDIPLIISEIIESSNCDDSTKSILKMKKDNFEAIMKNFKHMNLRTFQFFISKMNYLLEKFSSVKINEEYIERIRNHIISETFEQAVKFKSNYKPSRDQFSWLRNEQETKFQSIKEYIISGTYVHANYEHDILNLQKELYVNVPADDPYYLLYQQYFLNTQAWCEENIEKVLKRLESNKYPISFYVKIIIAIQRLINLGFENKYMDRTKKLMLDNIFKSCELNQLNPDVWYIEDLKFKESIGKIIEEINEAIKNHSNIISKEKVTDILKNEDWIDRLDKYINPKEDSYVQDKVVFSKAPTNLWVDVLNKASSEQIYDFRILLNSLYPPNDIRNSYLEDKDTIKGIIKELKNSKENDLIKKASISWLTEQFDDIVKCNEQTDKDD